MKYISFAWALLLSLATIVTPTLAQPRIVKTLTIEECLDLAQDRNVERRVSQLRKEVAQLRRQSAQHSYLPIVSLGLGQSVDLGRSQDKTGVLVDRSSASSSLSVSMNATLFSGLRRVYEGRIASHAVSRAEAEDEQARFELRLRTLQYYYSWLLAVEAEKSQARRQDLLELQLIYATQMYQEGRWAKSKVIEAQASLLSTHQALSEAKSSVRMAKLELLQHIELEEGDSIYVEFTPIDVEQRLRDQETSQPLSISSLIPQLLEGLPSMRALALGQEGAKLAVAQARTGYMPRLGLSAGYSNGYYYQFGQEYRPFNLSFVDQWRQNGRSYIGLNLGWNIFDAFATRTAIRSAKLDYRLVVMERERAQKQIVRQGKQLQEELELNLEQINASRAAYEASLEAYRLQKKSYEEGRSSSYELEDAITRMSITEHDLARSRINYLLRHQMIGEYERAIR